MYVTDLDTINFFNSFTRGINKEITTEDAIDIFKKDNDSRYFALIYTRVYKAINLLSKGIFSNYLTVEDIQSHCIEKLLESITKWDRTKSKKFITFYYNNVRNLLYVLVHQKYFRDLNKNCINFSDYLSSQDYDEGKDVLDFLQLPEKNNNTDKINFNNRLFNKEQNDIISFILKYNIRNKSEICQGLNISKKDLLRNLKSLKKSLYKFSII